MVPLEGTPSNISMDVSMLNQKLVCFEIITFHNIPILFTWKPVSTLISSYFYLREQKRCQHRFQRDKNTHIRAQCSCWSRSKVRPNCSQDAAASGSIRSGTADGARVEDKEAAHHLEDAGAEREETSHLIWAQRETVTGKLLLQRLSACGAPIEHVFQGGAVSSGLRCI